jgi:flagellar operon protein
LNNLSYIPSHAGVAVPPIQPAKVGSQGFQDLLNGVSVKSDAKVKFSSHALDRIERRGISITKSDEARLVNGMQSLKSKNVSDGLVVIDNKRFVVSVANNTVITIMASGDRDVYTNIQGVAFN